jgi:predicted MPP superfamily phosphohydrolase
MEQTLMNQPAQLSRREMLALSAGSLLTAGLWPGVLRAEETGNPGNFHFVVVNDVHYLNERCGKWVERVVRQIKAHPERIEFCLLAGDLTEHGKPEQMASMHELLKGLGKPTHVVVGNHDHRTQDDRAVYEQFFPQRINYRFEHNGWQFLGLDTTEGQRAYSTSVPRYTLAWLDETLPKLDKTRPTIVFTHFPLGPHVITRPGNADHLLARFKEYNLQAVFSGHYHALTERHMGKVTLTTNRCCSFSRRNHDESKEKGYFLCHAKDGTIQRTFIEVIPA